MEKFKYYCSDCGIEAIVEITDNPWEEEWPDQICCFYCGDDGVQIEEINDS